jgi:hypothetical protein
MMHPQNVWKANAGKENKKYGSHFNRRKKMKIILLIVRMEII